MPIAGDRPDELATNTTNSTRNGSMIVRQWSFINADQLKGVLFDEIQAGSSKIKVAKIGN